LSIQFLQLPFTGVFAFMMDDFGPTPWIGAAAGIAQEPDALYSQSFNLILFYLYSNRFSSFLEQTALFDPVDDRRNDGIQKYES